MGIKIIIDFQDVIYPTSFSLYKYFTMHGMDFASLMTLEPGVTLEKIESRPVKNLLPCIVKSDINKKELNYLMSKIHTEFLKSNYFDVSLTNPMIKKIFDSNLFKANIMFDEITIIYGYNYPEEKENIENYLFSIKNAKTKLLSYKRNGDSKQLSNIIKKLDWNLYITDNRKVVKEIIEDPDYKIIDKEFYISGRKYSKLASAEEILINEKGGKVSYY